MEQKSTLPEQQSPFVLVMFSRRSLLRFCTDTIGLYNIVTFD